jgi:hypothetical protein
MKIIALGSALAAALISTIAMSPPALAHDTTSTDQSGHFEWRSAPTFGPRAIDHSVRVWVGPPRMAANCDCSMMKGGQAQAAACMGMPKASQPHTTGKRLM